MKPEGALDTADAKACADIVQLIQRLVGQREAAARITPVIGERKRTVLQALQAIRAEDRIPGVDVP